MSCSLCGVPAVEAFEEQKKGCSINSQGCLWNAQGELVCNPTAQQTQVPKPYANEHFEDSPAPAHQYEKKYYRYS
jgi:hypothetical protein